jgi:hypothetical protein
MGAHSLVVTSEGTTASEAYENAYESAMAEFGHQQGYSGTVTTFDGFKEIPAPRGLQAKTKAKAIRRIFGFGLTEKEERKFAKAGFNVDQIRNAGAKWGPVAMMRLNKNTFVLWGYAAS